MDSEKYILALDQGTTSSRAIIVNRQGQVVASSQRGFEQIFPRPGWVEHDASEIWYTQSSVAAEAVAKANLTGLDIACIGITNQRETTVIWDRETSLPVYNAIVWQDRRTAAYCEELKGKGYEQAIHQKTGLILDAYFSATKIKWILDNIEGVRERAEKGKLCFGTIDSWLVWRFTRGGAHVTDVSNASRTMLFNIHTQQWDDDLLELFDIPRAILPEVKASSEVYCDTATTLFSTKIPISGIAGDQQAALFGQLCVEQGMSKTTYGTGCFVMMNTGDRPVFSQNGMLTTIAWKIGEQITYALEGSVFVGGAAIQWLRDGLEIVRSAHETEELALSVADSDGVYFVPALTGLGAPYWDQYARGLLRNDEGPYSPCGARGHRFRGVRRDPGHGARRDAALDGNESGRRCRGEQFPDAVPVRPDARRGRPAEDSGNDGDGSGLSGRTGRRLLEGYGGDRPLRRGRATLRARNAAVRGRAQDRALA